MKLNKYISELKRRNVFKAALAYLIMAWLVIQVSAIILSGFDAPAYVFKIIVFVIAIVFPFWLVFAWVYEITPEGLKKTEDVDQKASITHHTKRRLNKVIIACLLLVIIFLLFNQSWISSLKNVNANYSMANKNAEKSIVVLPFLNLSNNGNQEFLADGITEAINLELAKSDSLRVISRTSSMNYKGKKKLMPEIAKELKVDYLLEGSVLYDEDSIRITVQLIKPFPKEKHIWSNSYNERFENTIQLIENVSSEIANGINKVVLPNKLKPKKYKVDAKAYDLFLRGRYLMNQETYKSISSSIEYFKKSIKLDSSYAPVYASLADAYISLNKFNTDVSTKKINTKKGREAVNKALSLDNTLGAAYITRGKIVGKSDWNWDEMKKMAEKGLELNPNNSIGHMLLSDYYLIKHKYNKAIDEALFAEKLDPLNPIIGTLVAECYYIKNDYEKSIKQYEKVLELFPDYGFAWDGLGYVQYITGKDVAAINSWKRLQEIMGNESMAINFGFSSSIEQSFRFWLSSVKSESSHYVSNPTVIAQIQMFLNEKEEALDYLEIAYKKHDDDLPLVLLRPHFSPLHNDPRFKDLVKKTGVIIK
jgi:TolB-like protein